MACALAGLGLIQVPGQMVAEHIMSGRLVEVVPEMRNVRWPLSIMYPNRQYLAPQVRAFVDWMARLATSSNGPWLHSV